MDVTLSPSQSPPLSSSLTLHVFIDEGWDAYVQTMKKSCPSRIRHSSRSYPVRWSKEDNDEFHLELNLDNTHNSHVRHYFLVLEDCSLEVYGNPLQQQQSIDYRIAERTTEWRFGTVLLGLLFGWYVQCTCHEKIAGRVSSSSPRCLAMCCAASKSAALSPACCNRSASRRRRRFHQLHVFGRQTTLHSSSR